MRTQVMRRVQQGAGNHKTQQLVSQLRRPSSIQRQLIQRECSCGGTCSSCQSKGFHEEEEESKVMQRQATAAGPGGGMVDASVIPADSPGHPLDPSTRAFMEPRLGSDFSDVRVHTDARAAKSASALSADAYTTGRDIYFAAGKYTPTSHDGQHLLAHELTHTVQQANGAISPAASPAKSTGPHLPSQKLVLGQPGDRYEQEAEEKAKRVMNAPSAPKRKESQDTALVQSGAKGRPVQTVQRQPDAGVPDPTPDAAVHGAYVNNPTPAPDSGSPDSSANQAPSGLDEDQLKQLIVARAV
jgi:hypothetical protein